MDGKQSQRFVTIAGPRSVWSKISFRYQHRISMLIFIGADEKEYHTAAVFLGIREPSISNRVSHTKVSKLIPEERVAFRRRDVASVDTFISNKLVTTFTGVVQKRRNPQKWIIYFYDALRSHMSYYAIETIHAGNIAVLALPVHTSDRLQPLDLSIFGPWRHFAKAAVTNTAVEENRVYGRDAKLSGVWDFILHSNNKAILESNMKSAFRNAGLFPYGYSLLLGNGVRRGKFDERLRHFNEFSQLVNSFKLNYKRF